MNTIHHFIGGKVVPGESGRKQAVFNPATGEQIGEVMLASKAEVDKAVDAAQAALPGWSATPPRVST